MRQLFSRGGQKFQNISPTGYMGYVVSVLNKVMACWVMKGDLMMSGVVKCGEVE